MNDINEKIDYSSAFLAENDTAFLFCSKSLAVVPQWSKGCLLSEVTLASTELCVAN